MTTSTALTRLDLQTFLDDAGLTAYQWRAFALCFAIVLLDGFDTAAIGYIAPSLMAEWGVAKPALGPVLSAALFGLAAGALASGPLADRWGRKRVLVMSVALFALACLASSWARGLDELTALRFVTGLGLGAAMPNAVTLTSEYCPQPRRALLTNAMFCGFPLGAACGGFLAAWMIPHWGWQSVLRVGGLVPLALVLLLVVALPESARYLLARGAPMQRVRATLARISPRALAVERFTMAESALHGEGPRGFAVVLSPAYRVATLSLWTAYFMGLVIFYALINWMPILFRDAGLAPRDATLIASLFPLGGIGAIGLGWLMDRYNGNLVIGAGFALTTLAVFAIGQVAGTGVGALVFVVVVAGALMNTAQSSLPALAAATYPTAGRATGVSSMLGVGRFGGVLGSFLVAELARRQLALGEIFAVLALPGAIAAFALWVKQRARPAGIPTPAMHAAATDADEPAVPLSH